MATSYTPNLNLAKPLVDGPETENTWGFDLNANFDKIDAAIAVEAAPGPPGPPGGPSTVISGNGIVFSTRSVILVSAIDPAVLCVTTQGFSDPGDGGGGLYDRMGSAPTDTANPAYVQSSDGAWWQLVPQDGGIHIAQFGGKNDSNYGGATGNDNLAAINHAMRFTKWQLNPYYQFAQTIQCDAGHYRFSGTIEVRTICSIVGASSGKAANNSTWFHFPENTIPMLFQADGSVGQWGTGPSGGEGGGSGLKHISVAGKPTSTAHNLCGISVRCMVFFQSVGFYYIAGNALELKAGSGWGGGVNGGHFIDLYIHSCSRDAIWVNGGDANVCTFEHIDIHGPTWRAGEPIDGGVGGAGISDASWFGNVYKGVHIAGYGNGGVQHNGRRFFFIGAPDTSSDHSKPIGDSTIRGAVEPGTDQDVWYDIGPLAAPDAQFPAWSATPTEPHRLMVPIWTAGGASTFQGVYVEAQSAPCHGPGQTTCRGGIAWWTRQSNSISANDYFGVHSPGGFTGRQDWSTGEANNVWNGESTWAGVGTRATQEPNSGIVVFMHGRHNVLDGEAFWTYRYYNRDLLYSYGDPAGGVGWVWQVTTPSTDRTFGRSTPQPYVFNPSKFALGAGSGARQIGLHSDWATTPSGYHAEGEIILNGQAITGPYKDVVGWRCLVSGSPGALAELRAACLTLAIGAATVPSVAPGASSAILTATVPGAAVGDPVDVTINQDQQGMIITGWVSAPDTVKYHFFNPTAAPLTMTVVVYIRVRK